MSEKKSGSERGEEAARQNREGPVSQSKRCKEQREEVGKQQDGKSREEACEREKGESVKEQKAERARVGKRKQKIIDV